MLIFAYNINNDKYDIKYGNLCCDIMNHNNIHANYINEFYQYQVMCDIYGMVKRFLQSILLEFNENEKENQKYHNTLD